MRHIWTMNNFSLLRKGIHSSSFPSEKPKWIIRMSPRGNFEGDEGYVSISLGMVDNEEEVKVKGKFSIINDGKIEVRSQEFEAEFSGLDQYHLDRFLSRDYLFANAETLLPEDKLTIACEVNVSDHSHELFEDCEFNDAVISCFGKEFKVSKAILAETSPVFSAMFEQPMEEKKISRIEINDIRHEVLQEVLRFICSGKVRNLDDVAEGLLIAADKFALNDLVIMCEDALFKQVTIDNAYDMLIVADNHSFTGLATKLIRYIKDHPDALEPPGIFDTKFDELQKAFGI